MIKFFELRYFANGSTGVDNNDPLLQYWVCAHRHVHGVHEVQISKTLCCNF